jgi:hypothetical protein
VLELEQRRHTLVEMLDIIVAALDERVPEQAGALQRISPIGFEFVARDGVGRALLCFPAGGHGCAIREMA